EADAGHAAGLRLLGQVRVSAPVRPPPPEPEDLQPNRGVAVMVVGIVSCACYVLCLLIFWPALVVCLVTGPIAWVMGSQDLKGITGGELSGEGKSLVLTGYICGIVSTLLAIITLVPCLLLVGWFLHFISRVVDYPPGRGPFRRF